MKKEEEKDDFDDLIGQICLLFTAIFFVLTLAGIIYLGSIL